MKAVTSVLLGLTALAANAQRAPNPYYELTIEQAICGIDPFSTADGDVDRPFVDVDIYVTDTFSNPCRVPSANELGVIIGFGVDGSTNINVGVKSLRVCTQEYNPTPATLKVARLTLSSSEEPFEVIVNGLKVECGIIRG